MWGGSQPAPSSRLLDEVVAPELLERLDRFDRVQLQDVLEVCRRAPSLSAAGCVLFDRSRERKNWPTMPIVCGKYLAGFELEWVEVKEKLAQTGALAPATH